MRDKGWVWSLTLLVGMAWSLPATSWAASYYVASQGDDQQDGLSEATAWGTVLRANKALKNLQPDDRLLFRRGDRFVDDVLKVRSSGAVGKPIVVGAYGEGAAPVFDGERQRSSGIFMHAAGVAHIVIENLHIANSADRGGIAADADNLEDIVIQNVTIENIAKGNGIMLSGVRGYRVENACIRGVENNGIYVSSRPGSLAENGVLRRNVVDGRGTSNDCITLHQASKKKNATENGGGHLIEGNVVYHCGEQGFDLTSGFDIIVRDNTSFENREGAILTSEQTRNVLIERHLSIRDADKMGAVLMKHDGMRMVDSMILAPRYHGLVISPGKGFEASGNLFLFDKAHNSSMIDVLARSQNAHFHHNRMVSLNPRSGPFVRFLAGTNAENTKSRFHDNIWWKPGNVDEMFQDDGLGKFGLGKWQSRYGQGSGSRVARVDVTEAEKWLVEPRKPTVLEQKCWGEKAG